MELWVIILIAIILGTLYSYIKDKRQAQQNQQAQQAEE